MTEKEVLLDVTRRLEAIGLAYMLTGSLASTYYGVPRFTHDVDIVLQNPPAAAAKLASVLRPDYFVDEQMIAEAHRGTRQFNVLHHESGVKIDFWLPRSDPFHRSMFARRRKESVWGTDIWICTPEDVILHKLYWNKLTPSERQVGDARGVIQVRGDRLDWNYLERWAREITVSDVLAQLRGQS